jgi:sugar phosphate isomerase/epimerase
MKLPRRTFLKTTAVLASTEFFSPFSFLNKKKPLLAFSTLGCPKWTFPQIVKCAIENGYQGIEIRGLMGELDLPKCPEFSAANMASTRRLVEDNRLRIVDLGSSAKMHFKDKTKRQANMDDAKRFIDLAQKLNCPNIRVFPDDLPADQQEDETVDLIIKGLLELGEYAKSSSVNILLESHGKVVHSDLLFKIMKGAEHPNVGLIWDFHNMWSVTKEPPKEVYQKLKKYIKHVHVKDAKNINGKENYTLLGEGESPLSESLLALKKGGYKGYYSFEWEKMWHPEIQEPEVAIPHYAKAFQKFWQ